MSVPMWVKTSRQITSELSDGRYHYVVSNNEDNVVELEYVENNMVSKTITMDVDAAEAIGRLILIAASEVRTEEAKENANGH